MSIEHHAALEGLQPGSLGAIVQATHQRFHAVDVAELALFRSLNGLRHIGMVAVHITQVEHLAAFTHGFDQLGKALQVLAAGLFHVDVLACLGGHDGIFVQMDLVGLHGDSLDGGIVQDLLQGQLLVAFHVLELVVAQAALILHQAVACHLENVGIPLEGVKNMGAVAEIVESNLRNADLFHTITPLPAA